jgi:O-antigen/teichoic acid export membrane protein
VSRTRRAAISAGFGYAGFVLSLLSGIVLVPFTLSRVGTATYGVWLAFGELVAYSAMVDLGVLGIVPWLVAEGDGRRDREGIRDVVAAGFTLSLLAAVAFAAVALVLLAAAPSVSRVTVAQRSTVLGPVLLVVGATAVAYPLRTFTATLAGLQDVVYNGMVSVAQQALSVALLVSLLVAGYGVWALAAAAAVPPVLAASAAVLRLHRVDAELLRGWRLPTRGTVWRLATGGFGSWTAGLGWRMVAASDSLILLSVAGPAMAVVFAVTSKLGDVLTQMSWQLPDAGHVGLAQLAGEGRPERVREVVVAMLRVTLLASGAVAGLVLAFNPTFVTLWVGAGRFGGLAMNGLFAAEVVTLSLTHSLIAPAATLGERLWAGYGVVAQGVVHVALALALGHLFGAAGVVGAGLASSMLVGYPVAVHLLRRASGLTQRELLAGAIVPWLARAAPLLALAGATGYAARTAPWLAFAATPVLGLAYLWIMRPLYHGIPVPARAHRALIRLRLVPE